MKQPFLFIISLLFLYFFSVPELNGQTHAIVRGRLTDASNGDPVMFVNIGIKNKPGGTFTDPNGYYKLEVPKGEAVIVFSCIGYEKVERSVNAGGSQEVELNVLLKPIAQELSTVVVSGSKYEQKAEESIATIEVLKAQTIQSSNPSSVDKAIDKMPGIAIVNDEPQIRGGEWLQFGAWQQGHGDG